MNKYVGGSADTIYFSNGIVWNLRKNEVGESWKDRRWVNYLIDIGVRHHFTILDVERGEEERSYILTVRQEPVAMLTDPRTHRITLYDCNHEKHAINRFKKRMDEVGELSGQPIQVTVETKDSLIVPTNPQELTPEQRERVEKALDFTLCEGRSCVYCIRNLVKYNEEIASSRAATNTETSPTVDEVVELVEKITEEMERAAKESLLQSMYELELHVFPNPPLNLCAHSDVLWLLRKAKELQGIFADMTPNVTFNIFDRRGEVVARVTNTGEVVIY